MYPNPPVHFSCARQTRGARTSSTWWALWAWKTRVLIHSYEGREWSRVIQGALLALTHPSTHAQWRPSFRSSIWTTFVVLSRRRTYSHYVIQWLYGKRIARCDYLVFEWPWTESLFTVEMLPMILHNSANCCYIPIWMAEVSFYSLVLSRHHLNYVGNVYV